MKYSEAEKQTKALSSKYDISMIDGDFNVLYNGKEDAIYVSDYYEYELHIKNNRAFSKLPFSRKLYRILSELAMTPRDERVEEKKYYVKIFDGELGYLNIDISTGDITAGSMGETEYFKTKFTNKAIEQLKQRDNIPLDWDKVHFMDVAEKVRGDRFAEEP
ncbi:hypothetical protein AH70_09495 [Pediococcus damnosus LMG 28219]|uniref:hypothetical protein n=1 Tax=Pediococcus damnosus TaxID=51663 RepID=UPI00061EFD11|nr:hypothetical protein [Pediococcus damnosus]KJU75141.1 hypothetical protein AH70_09495 [Pediococcus damnosus LMG 28219]